MEGPLFTPAELRLLKISDKVVDEDHIKCLGRPITSTKKRAPYFREWERRRTAKNGWRPGYKKRKKPEGLP